MKRYYTRTVTETRTFMQVFSYVGNDALADHGYKLVRYGTKEKQIQVETAKVEVVSNARALTDAEALLFAGPPPNVASNDFED